MFGNRKIRCTFDVPKSCKKVIMNQKIPLLDIPVDIIAGDDVTGQLLNDYGRFPCRIKACIFALCVQGEITTKVDLENRKIKAGDFVTILPDTFLQIQVVSPDTLIYFAGFSYSFYQNTVSHKLSTDFIRQLKDTPVFELQEDLIEFYKNAFKTLLSACMLSSISLNADIKHSILSLFFQSIANICQQSYNNQTEIRSREEEIHKEFIRLVIMHYTQEHNVSFYADKLGITLPHLCTTIKKAANKTATQIINDAILTDAKAQLKSTHKQVKEIAFSLGFNNVSFFNKYFKKHVNLTPKQYREG